MSMTIANVFIKEPCTGWGPYKWDKIGHEPYEDLNELLKAFASHGEYDSDKFQILRSWQEKIVGNCLVYHLEIKTIYQTKHTEVNQAEYEAIITIVEE